MSSPIVKLIGTLPKGDWLIGLISIERSSDVLLVLDRSGVSQPRIVTVDGKMHKVKGE